MLGRITITTGVKDNLSTIGIDGEDPGDALRSEEVNANVSAISAIPEGRVLIGIFTRLDPVKGHAVFLRARSLAEIV